MNILTFFNNLKLENKLFLSFSFICLMMISIGFSGFYFSNEANNKIKHIYNEVILPNQYLATLKSNNVYAKSLVYKMVLTDDETEKKEMAKILKDIRIRQNKALKNYKATHMDAREKELYAQIEKDLAAWREVRDYTIKKSLTDTNKFELIKYFAKNSDVINDLIKDYDELIQYSEDSAEKIMKKITQDNYTAIFIILLINAAGIVISLLLKANLSNNIVNPINNVVSSLELISKGDLTVKELAITSKDEMGILANALNSTVKSLKTLVSQVSQSVEDISAASEEMSASADQTAQGSQQTADSTAQLAEGAQEISQNVEIGATTIGNMNKVIQGISKEAIEIADLGNSTEKNANEGSEHVQKAVGKIDSIKIVSEDISHTVTNLGSLSAEIETIVELIKSIAAQTNLLALNAAIEAARAGEHGKGFAVVADEVKKLAGQSADATDKITTMIKEIQNETSTAVNKMNKATHEVEEGVIVVNDAGKALENIISQVKTANIKIQHITKEIEGVATNSEDVVKMVENISAVSEQTAASAEAISSITEEQTASMEEISASSQTLAKIAEELNMKVSVFKI